MLLFLSCLTGLPEVLFVPSKDLSVISALCVVERAVSYRLSFHTVIHAYPPVHTRSNTARSGTHLVYQAGLELTLSLPLLYRD